MPLKNLGFTRRALIALENAGYTEVGQMMELTENQMRNLPGIGNVAANNIIATLKTVGVYLK
jgi:DNA-directed RNA polymerase alpha subunit